jgi:phosphatidate cytidylyltransferase
MLVDYYRWYLRILHFDRRVSLDVDLGPVHVHLDGRPVFLMWVTIAILAIGGLAVIASRKRELIDKWASWMVIAPVFGIPIWMGKGPTAVVAAAVAVVAVIEYARLVKLSRVDAGLLLVLGVCYPIAAWLRPSLLGLAPILVLACALPSVLGGDVEQGVRRTWCGGKGLRRFGWARHPLSRLSPNKTIGGLFGAFVGAFLVLTLLGTISIGLLIAVAFGGLAGDLLESMVKRDAQVKDAGTWLPGFGGLLDRIDSLLVVLPLAYVIG